jgi:hypothetical protein
MTQPALRQSPRPCKVSHALLRSLPEQLTPLQPAALRRFSSDPYRHSGSEPLPYKVRADFTQPGDIQSSCTCQDGVKSDGKCKHVAAVRALSQANQNPEAGEHSTFPAAPSCPSALRRHSHDAPPPTQAPGNGRPSSLSSGRKRQPKRQPCRRANRPPCHSPQHRPSPPPRGGVRLLHLKPRARPRRRRGRAGGRQGRQGRQGRRPSGKTARRKVRGARRAAVYRRVLVLRRSLASGVAPHGRWVGAPSPHPAERGAGAAAGSTHQSARSKGPPGRFSSPTSCCVRLVRGEGRGVST